MEIRNQETSGGVGRSVLVLSINYAPELTGFSPHVAAFCEHLAAQGYHVTVFTGFPFAPNWSRWPEYRGRFKMREDRAGVRIVRHTHFIPRTPRSFFQRILMEGSFCATAILSLISFRSRPDLLIYVGAQPSIAMLSRFWGWLLGIPYGVMINDLAAGAAADVGILKPGILQRLLQAFEASAYRAASGAVVLCQGFKTALVAWGYPENRIRIIPSPIDIERVRPMATDLELRRRHGFSSENFVVLFAGSMGLKQGLANVIAAARLLATEAPEIRWLLVGDGETRAQLERLIEESGLAKTVRLIPFLPAEQISNMLSMGDILLLNQLASVKDTVIPSKLLTYMASGRPVLAAVNAASQAADLLRATAGGRIIPPEDSVALAAAVKEMQKDSYELLRMGRVNRQYAVDHFDQRQVLRRLESFVREASASRSAR
jgi:glycosyltransferase involved in cell wall biosynthesis